MKKIITILFVIINLHIFAQSPQAFNYQAIIRNNSGNIITNQSVNFRISLISDSINGTTSYIETHTVNTDASGLVSLQIGNGQIVSGDFNSINWANGPFFIKIEMDPLGGLNYQLFGTTKLLSVPYALYAQNSGSDNWHKNGENIYNSNNGNIGIGTNTPNSKLEIKGNNDTLFQVKDNNGNPVFIVFPEGVQVYVKEGASKGNIGGFAVSGRSATKGIIGDYLKVTPDSVRVYLNESNNKGNIGGFAVSGRSATKGLVRNFFDVSIDTTGTIFPSQARIVWYPTKEAFLAGKVLIEHKDSVGRNSFATGFEAKARGGWSQAMGYKVTARGFFSTAIGYKSVANGNSSFAFGEEAKANAHNSFAFGTGAIANGMGSFSFGSAGRDTLGNLTGFNTQADGKFSFAIGLGAHANGVNSLSIGANSEAIGKSSLSVGIETNATGSFAVALGYKSTASGTGSIALGIGLIDNLSFLNTTSSGMGSIAIGPGAKSEGTWSFALGYKATAKAIQSFAFGYNMSSGNNAFATGYTTTAHGDFSFSMNNSTTAGGMNSVAMNYATVTKSANSVAMGSNTLAKSMNSLVIGRYNDTTGSGNSWNQFDPLFVIGNGMADNLRSNAFTVLKNGNTGINITNPSTSLEINGAIALRKKTITITNLVTDLNIANYTFIKITGPTTAFSINTISDASDGKMVILYNSTDFNMTLKNETGLLLNNRILTNTGGDISTSGSGTITLIYDGESQRWIVTSVQP